MAAEKKFYPIERGNEGPRVRVCVCERGSVELGIYFKRRLLQGNLRHIVSQIEDFSRDKNNVENC